MDNNKTVKDYDNYIRAMVTKIMKAKNLHFPYEKEDLVQQVWVEVLKDEADFALIPSICQTTIDDIIDSNMAEKRGGKVEKVSLDPTLDFIKELIDTDSSDQLNNSNVRASLDRLWANLNEKEQEYLKFYLEKADIEDFGIHPPVPEHNDHKTGPVPDGYTEDFIAKRLGFPSKRVSSYQRFKRNFKDKVSKYIGR